MTIGFLFLCGLLTGSFVNLCIHRLPLGISIVHPGSRCPRCHHRLAAWENIPVLSYVLLRGRCHGCGESISPRYPLTELLCGGIFAAAGAHFGAGAVFVKFTYFAVSMLLLVATDLDTRQLPDEVTLGGLVTGLALAAWVPPVAAAAPGLAALGTALTGALAGAGSLWLVGWAYRRWRGREGMGLGDVKMMGMIGAFLGPLPTLITLVLASIGGACGGVLLTALFVPWRWRRLRRRGLEPARAWARLRASTRLYFSLIQIPFGVFLGLASLLAWFWGQPLWQWYLGIALGRS